MFQDRLKDCADQVSACLGRVISGFGDDPVVQAMGYGADGGKRLRAFLVMESARLHGLVDGQSVWAATAVEALHAYSLIHDDLPCMDDDDLRRGRATVHVKWDQATAVLAGDALQALAFEVLAHEDFSVGSGAKVALVTSLARAAGAGGMVLGQAQDIAAETAKSPLSLNEITALQANKTGALIEWAAQAGPVMADADAGAMGRYSQALGLAFQIADDILDVEGDASKAGKRVGKDAKAGKATFVSLLGLDGAKAKARALIDEADAALAPYGDGAQPLREAARFVISRDM